MLPSYRPTVRRFAEAVFLAGGVVLAWTAATTHLNFIRHRPLAFGLLAIGVLLGELLPLQIPRRGEDEQITVSTSFSFALLLIGGLAPALITQCCASIVQDVAARKPLWRVRFNIGQYALSMAAALLTMQALSDAPHTHSPRPFDTTELPVVLLGIAVFFAVNSGIVGTAIALYQDVPLRKYFRNDWAFSAITGGVLLCLAPIVVAATQYSLALLPMFMAPLLALYRAGREAVRSEHNARHDSLTELPNRMTFREVVERTIAKGEPCCVLLMDLNRFKEVNDTLGHHYGDLLLERIAGRLREAVGDRHVVARLGGDEFAILGSVADRAAARELAESIAASLQTSFELEEFVVDAEASFGIATFPADGADVDTLLQKADVAMYRAKETHAGVALYDESNDHNSPAKLALTADLRSAIAGDELVVWYQPLLDLHTGDVHEVEALVRWQHPDLGLLPPAAFLGMAEHTTLIKPLTDRVLNLALRQVAAWQALGIDVRVAVNVSMRVLVEHEFLDRVRAALAATAVNPSSLKLEITETAIMADPRVVRELLEELQELGVAMSIDDFGTGYSSLAYLKDLPISEVKIDQSFVSGMAAGSRDAVIVSSVIDLGHHLGLRVVAEGVEAASTLERVREMGCDLAQGHAINPAAAAEEITGWLLARQAAGSARTLAMGLQEPA